MPNYMAQHCIEMCRYELTPFGFVDWDEITKQFNANTKKTSPKLKSGQDKVPAPVTSYTHTFSSLFKEISQMPNSQSQIPPMRSGVGNAPVNVLSPVTQPISAYGGGVVRKNDKKSKKNLRAKAREPSRS